MRFSIDIVGDYPFLMHNSRLANPLDPAAKAVAKVVGKTRKTDDDHEEIARLEHAGGMYFDPDAGPYIPSDNVWRSLYDGATKHKLGVKVKTAVFFEEQVNPLAYKGPRDINGLWADENFRFISSVKLRGSRMMRCRPMFAAGWKIRAEGLLDTEVLDYEQLVMVAATSGKLIGLGDWRPKFGRYTATVRRMKG